MHLLWILENSSCSAYLCNSVNESFQRLMSDTLAFSLLDSGWSFFIWWSYSRCICYFVLFSNSGCLVLWAELLELLLFLSPVSFMNWCKVGRWSRLRRFDAWWWCRQRKSLILCHQSYVYQIAANIRKRVANFTSCMGGGGIYETDTHTDRISPVVHYWFLVKFFFYS